MPPFTAPRSNLLHCATTEVLVATLHSPPLVVACSTTWQMRLAEEKKLGVREQLAAIRQQFEALLTENNGKPDTERLPRSEFEIDPGERPVSLASLA